MFLSQLLGIIVFSLQRKKQILKLNLPTNKQGHNKTDQGHKESGAELGTRSTIHKVHPNQATHWKLLLTGCLQKAGVLSAPNHQAKLKLQLNYLKHSLFASYKS